MKALRKKTNLDYFIPIFVLGGFLIIASCGTYRQAPAPQRIIDEIDTVGVKVFTYFGDTISTYTNRRPDLQWQGKYLNFSHYFAKPVDKLFDTIGKPDLQTGWLCYYDYVNSSIFAKCFPDKYIDEEIPVKVYAWSNGAEFLVCFCTYNDKERALSFPFTYRLFDNSSGYFNDWFTYHSNDEGFYIFQWKIVKGLDDWQIDAEPGERYPPWCAYNERQEMDIRNYYFSNFRFRTEENDSTTLSSVVGTRRGELHFKYEKLSDSHIYCRTNMPQWLKEETYIIKDELPWLFRVDKYRNKRIMNNEYDVIYDLQGKLLLIAVNREGHVHIDY